MAATALPPPIRRIARWGRSLIRATDRRLRAGWAARRGMVPPRGLWPMVGGGGADFVEQGRGFFQFLVEKGRVTPQSAVLDVGCGLGKHALHFADFLDARGRFDGFDIEDERIAWCQAAIMRRHPNMVFRHTPLRSAFYNPRGVSEASAFVFPYPDARFDLVYLGSVFTHMMAPEIEQYLREIARVLKPGGRCVATMYLLDDARRARIAEGGTAFRFAISHRSSWVETLDPPEAAVAQERDRMTAAVAAAGLFLAEPIRYGAWSVSTEQDQDFLVLEKP